MANIDTKIILGKHLRSALTAVMAKINVLSNNVVTKGEQTLTPEEKKQARNNIGASDFSGSFSDLTDNTAVLYTVQSLTESQKAQVRSNIGAGASSFSGNYSDLFNRPTNLSDFTNDSGYVTTTEVATAIANSKHATFEVVSSVPTASTAKENVFYLFKNTETNYYDIYAKVGNNIERLDDVNVDLSQYSNTTQMNTAISTAVANSLKYSAQSLSEAEKTQALTNLGIAFAEDSDVTTILTELGIA